MAVAELCPHCGAALDPGTLGVGSYIGGAAWFRQRSELALHGETIVSKPLGGMVWIDGGRCRKCRLLLLSY